MRHVWRKWSREITAFWHGHRALILFTALLLVGCAVGVGIWCRFGGITALTGVLQVTPVESSFVSAIRAVLASGFAGWMLLGFLYLMGLTPFGAIPATLVPVFYGLGIGVCAAGHYAVGWRGLAFTALLILPHSVLCAAALLIGCCLAVRMSASVGQVLLPAFSGGSLAAPFRLYSVRFLLLFLVVLGSGVMDVVLRLCFCRFFG